MVRGLRMVLRGYEKTMAIVDDAAWAQCVVVADLSAVQPRPPPCGEKRAHPWLIDPPYIGIYPVLKIAAQGMRPLWNYNKHGNLMKYLRCIS